MREYARYNTGMWKHDLLDAAPWKGRGRPRYAHLKIDGHRRTFFVQESGAVVAFTTRGHDDWPNLRELPFALSVVKLPPLTSVDAELYVPGYPRSEVKHRLATGGTGLRLAVFALPWYAGLCRYGAELGCVENLCRTHGLEFAPFCIPTAGWTTEGLLKLTDGEGWVLKTANYRGWWKLKRERTIDLVVTGFKQSDSDKYIGGVGSIRCSALNARGQLVEVASVSGMSDEVRWDINEHLDLGRCLQVRYQYVGSRGRLLHPRFDGWRDDKRPDRCTTSQDPDLEEVWDGEKN